MRFRALPYCYTPLRDVTCASCGAVVTSPSALEDTESRETYCAFCAEQHDRYARQRLMQGTREQFDRLPEYRKRQVQERLSIGKGSA